MYLLSCRTLEEWSSASASIFSQNARISRHLYATVSAFLTCTDHLLHDAMDFSFVDPQAGLKRKDNGPSSQNAGPANATRPAIAIPSFAEVQRSERAAVPNFFRPSLGSNGPARQARSRASGQACPATTCLHAQPSCLPLPLPMQRPASAASWRGQRLGVSRQRDGAPA